MRGLLLSTLALMFISGCAATKVAEKAPCDQTDWYEIGRRDGSQGSPTEKLTSHEKTCRRDFRSEWEKLYTNGRNAGLVEYCDQKNAYELGRMGVKYYYVCPST